MLANKKFIVFFLFLLLSSQAYGWSWCAPCVHTEGSSPAGSAAWDAAINAIGKQILNNADTSIAFQDAMNELQTQKFEKIKAMKGKTMVSFQSLLEIEQNLKQAKETMCINNRILIQQIDSEIAELEAMLLVSKK